MGHWAHVQTFTLIIDSDMVMLAFGSYVLHDKFVNMFHVYWYYSHYGILTFHLHYYSLLPKLWKNEYLVQYCMYSKRGKLKKNISCDNYTLY